MPNIETLKYPGFESLLGYLKHLKDRAAELKAVKVEITVETLDDCIEKVWMLEELNK